MRNITYFKLFNRENLNIDSSSGMHAVVAFMQIIFALMDGADRIEQIPCFLEKNKKFVKSIGLPVIPHSTTFYKLLKRINKDG